MSISPDLRFAGEEKLPIEQVYANRCEDNAYPFHVGNLYFLLDRVDKKPIRCFLGDRWEPVKLVCSMGTDVFIANIARVSMDKWSWNAEANPSDVRLLNYLAKHKHWSPFYHPQVSFRMKCAIPIARQIFKHNVGMAFNEVSRRYVTSEPEFCVPYPIRLASPSIKQGSVADSNHPDGLEVLKNSIDYIQRMTKNYEHAVRHRVKDGEVIPGMPAEQARMMLPQCMMTEFIATGSLFAWYHFYELRADAHAQVEIQIYAGMVGRECERLFPFAWAALCNKSTE